MPRNKNNDRRAIIIVYENVYIVLVEQGIEILHRDYIIAYIGNNIYDENGNIIGFVALIT